MQAPSERGAKKKDGKKKEGAAKAADAASNAPMRAVVDAAPGATRAQREAAKRKQDALAVLLARQSAAEDARAEKAKVLHEKQAAAAAAADAERGARRGKPAATIGSSNVRPGRLAHALHFSSDFSSDLMQ